jgi:hypothetical protein
MFSIRAGSVADFRRCKVVGVPKNKSVINCLLSNVTGYKHLQTALHLILLAFLKHAFGNSKIKKVISMRNKKAILQNLMPAKPFKKSLQGRILWRDIPFKTEEKTTAHNTYKYVSLTTDETKTKRKTGCLLQAFPVQVPFSHFQ